ncbi:MAG TPA: serine/threonine-protein kinase [Planctomycetota bacterium]|nr:serine/threonine-protein kinase [Planctomycetota bacterium]
MSQVAAGTLLHGHRLHRRIGGGLYGEVWSAEFQGRPVALKLITGDRPRAALKRELFVQHALGRIDGQDGRWFPRVDHVDLDAEPPYVRMELVDGLPLEDVLADPAIPLDERLALGRKILEALAVVHRHGFVHGDLSPQNVLVTPERDVRLIDVGFGGPAEAADITLSHAGADAHASGVASPLYSAPERFNIDGPAGPGKPADVFSFGKLLYRLITGQQPFVIKPVSLKFRALGSGWDDFLFRCLEERPEARFADAGEALAEWTRIWRPALAPGEYRVECPECRAAQSVPGGWAGERFDCRCGRRLEILFYDDASRYATSALVVPGEPEPPIRFLDVDPAEASRARKFCPRCGGEMRVDAATCARCGVKADEEARRLVRSAAPAPSFVAPALVTLLGYIFFWLPGAILNLHFLSQAKKESAGRSTPAGYDALRVMFWLFLVLPVAGVSAVVIGAFLLVRLG